MTTRHAGYMVVLREDIREDDAEAVLNALRMVSGVVGVVPVESSYEQVIANSRANAVWVDRLLQLVREAR